MSAPRICLVAWMVLLMALNLFAESTTQQQQASTINQTSSRLVVGGLGYRTANPPLPAQSKGVVCVATWLFALIMVILILLTISSILMVALALAYFNWMRTASPSEREDGAKATIKKRIFGHHKKKKAKREEKKATRSRESSDSKPKRWSQTNYGSTITDIPHLSQ